MRQDTWKKQLENIISSIPEVLEDDPQQDHLREVAIEKLRNAIAERWVAVRNIAARSHAAEYDEILQQTKGVISELVSCYGADIAFAPFPDIVAPFPDPVALGMEESNMTIVPSDARDDNPSICGSGKSSRGSSTTASLLQHDYRYLTTKQQGTWTCLVVAWWLLLNCNPYESVSINQY